METTSLNWQNNLCYVIYFQIKIWFSKYSCHSMIHVIDTTTSSRHQACYYEQVLKIGWRLMKNMNIWQQFKFLVMNSSVYLFFIDVGAHHIFLWDFFVQQGVPKSHILQVDSLLAVQWIKPRDLSLLLYIMMWFSGNMWHVLPVQAWMESFLEVGGDLLLLFASEAFHCILFQLSYLKMNIILHG